MKNYKIHVIFAYYYKTILLSFINKKKTRERHTKQNTHKHAKSDTPKGRNKPSLTLPGDSHFTHPQNNNNNKQQIPFLRIKQKRSIYRKQPHKNLPPTRVTQN